MKDFVRAFILKHNLLCDSDRVIVSVSGGIDSMTLLCILQELGYALVCVHFNHEVRGSDSESDAATVTRYCGTFGLSHIELRIGEELRGLKRSHSFQARARDIRYAHLRRIAVEKGISRIAVAHNRDDQAETVLLNLLRGTGLDGIAAMRPIRELGREAEIQLIRPFLGVRRLEIEAYALDQNIPWREDASNRNPRYIRNRIRHEIIPALQRIPGPGAGRVPDARPDFIDDIAEAAEEMSGLVDEDFPDLLPRPLQNWRNFDAFLPVDPLLGLPEIVRSWLVLRAVRYWLPDAPVRKTTVSAIERLLSAQPGKRVQFKKGCIWRERRVLRFDPLHGSGEAADERQLVDASIESVELISGSPVPIEQGELSLNFVGDPRILKDSNRNCVFLDYEKVKGLLRVRPWRAGDRFVPFGMKGSKKVKAYLTDSKVEIRERTDTRVVCDDEKIVWLVGYRLDDRVRVDANSKRIARLSLTL